MGKTNLKIEYVLKAANNIGFDNIDTYISKIIFEHYNKIPTYTLEKMLSILNVSKPKFKAYLNQIGYKNFTAFKDEIIFEKIVRIKQIRERYDKFEKDKILSVINQLRKSPIDMNDIDGICYEINKHGMGRSRRICDFSMQIRSAAIQGRKTVWPLFFCPLLFRVPAI